MTTQLLQPPQQPPPPHHTSASVGGRVHNACFQRDGTRHVSLTGNLKLTWDQVRRLEYDPGTTFCEFPIRFDGLHNWGAGKGVS
mmetsp:Transcript_20286/g.56014  ORF Transcript_20286/g.56014 Transcript_20286/m.56014 type:complete len:84 (-) Transcript_20286:646-897(-)